MCLCYLDDIIVFSETFDDHLQRLRNVLKCIQDAGLVLNPKKCVFGSRQIKILEHLVSEEGIMPDPGKVRAVQNFPAPKSICDVRIMLLLPYLGFAKLYDRIRKRFFWPRLYRSVRRDVMHCRECQRRKSVPHKPPGLLIPIPSASVLSNAKVGLSEKLLKRYFGPYRVVRKLSDVTYEVEELEPSPRRRKSTQIVHILRMKKYYTPESQECILTNDTENLPSNAPAGATYSVGTEKRCYTRLSWRNSTLWKTYDEIQNVKEL
ncbi:retrovirus-related Pol polyprotein from transposon 297 [Trichonephila inaurata madagascariensis]|uniref:RNA-directed DNA polymerase n=1 Tax=Trichonephila inaurata madagascariensis TaxID=2747483 RepID=A0A8X7BWV8_9ARAC|nr:retrovirus-related Pol polyprotein from transposon 297 [Trichonephila inaurata madagascariensis]